MRLSLFVICCLQLFMANLCYAQWSHEIDDFKYIFSPEVLRKKHIRSCTAKQMYYNKEAMKGVYDPCSFYDDQYFEFDTMGNMLRCIYWRNEPEMYWQYRNTYDTNGNIISKTYEIVYTDSTVIKKIIQNTYNENRLIEQCETLPEYKHKAVNCAYFYYTNNKIIADSVRAIYKNDNVRRMHSPSKYEWKNDTVYGRKYLSYGNDEEYHQVLADTREYPSNRMLEHEDGRGLRTFDYDNNGLIKSIRNNFVTRTLMWEYGCVQGLKRKDYERTTKPPDSRFILTYTDKILTKMEFKLEKIAEPVVRLDFVYTYY